MISLISPSEIKNTTSIGIGSFDGLHEGHRKLIESVVREEQHIPTIASFWPHPREILYRETRLRLDLPEEKLPLLESLGIKQLVLIPFNIHLSRMSPEKFVQNILLDQLQAKSISVGANFQFGYKRSGNIKTIEKITDATDTKLKIVPILKDDQGRISSSRVRELLQKSDLHNAEKLLKRPYSFTGKVVKGKGIGKTIGCPTANLEIDGRKLLPGEGVYAAWTICKKYNKRFQSVMNLGPQPTINPLSPSAVEVHLIDKEIYLYDLKLIVKPVQKIRSQIKFESLDQLSKQIYQDKEEAKKILSEVPIT